MTSRFLNPCPDLRTPSGDFHNFLLLGVLAFLDGNGKLWIALPGTTTDCLSVPDVVSNIIRQNGKLARAGVIHDAAYRNTLVTVVNGRVVVANLSRKERDELLLEMIRALGECEAVQQIIFGALRVFGGKALEGDLSMPIPHIDEAAILAAVAALT